jgi:hypothetical protein
MLKVLKQSQLSKCLIPLLGVLGVLMNVSKKVVKTHQTVVSLLKSLIPYLGGLYANNVSDFKLCSKKNMV